MLDAGPEPTYAEKTEYPPPWGLAYLKFSDPLPETHFFIWPNIIKRGAVILNLGLSLHLHPNFAYASNEGSCESAHLLRLA